jgi:hypothetical protein
MQETQTVSREREPFLQLVVLFGLIFLGLLVASVVSFVLGFFTYGTEVLKDPSLLTNTTAANIGYLKIQLVIQQVFTFLLPAWLLAVIEKRKIGQFYGLKMPKLNLLVIVFLIMLCSTPILGYVNELNLKMHLPAFLKGLENLMRSLEDSMAVTTAAILKMDTVFGLLVNFLVIALVPAICEELLFRGALQRTLLRLITNKHVAVWAGAIIFSAIHLQFFGFFPRMFLGAAFGYIYLWTGSLRYTIFAHFLNNGYAVTIAYYMQKNNIPVEKADEINIAWYGYFISAFLTIALFWILKDKAGAKEIKE